LGKKLIATLFEINRNEITKHLANIYKEGNQDVEFYNLDAIISIGYRVNSRRATAFRQ
jgi:hypothetical protein